MRDSLMNLVHLKREFIYVLYVKARAKHVNQFKNAYLANLLFSITIWDFPVSPNALQLILISPIFAHLVIPHAKHAYLSQLVSHVQ